MGKETNQQSLLTKILLSILVLIWKAFLVILLALIRFFVVLLNFIGEKIETYLNIKKPK